MSGGHLQCASHLTTAAVKLAPWMIPVNACRSMLLSSNKWNIVSRGKGLQKIQCIKSHGLGWQKGCRDVGLQYFRLTHNVKALFECTNPTTIEIHKVLQNIVEPRNFILMECCQFMQHIGNYLGDSFQRSGCCKVSRKRIPCVPKPFVCPQPTSQSHQQRLLSSLNVPQHHTGWWRHHPCRVWSCSQHQVVASHNQTW